MIAALIMARSGCVDFTNNLEIDHIAAPGVST